MRRITITGANGFVGHALTYQLSIQPELTLTTIGRKTSSIPGVHSIVSDAPDRLDISNFPSGDVLIHLAAYPEASKSLDSGALKSINVDWSKQLAKFAVEKNYSHIIFLSSAKVLGDYSSTVFTKDSPLKPNSFYAESKCEAELAINCYSDDIAITVLRPPAIYGTPFKAGFKRIQEACQNKGFIPSAFSENRRSFVSLNNVVSAISAVLDNSKKGQLEFLIHDGEIISTQKCIDIFSTALDSKPKLVKMPSSSMAFLDRLFKVAFGNEPLAALHRDCFIQCNYFSEHFDWQAIHSTTDGLKMAAKAHLEASTDYRFVK